MVDEHEASFARLHEIASMLGIPVEDMFVRTMPKKFWADSECVRLWYSLKTDADRDAALDALRKILDEERR